MVRRSALSNAGASIFGGVPSIDNFGRSDRAAEEHKETNDYRHGNRMRSNASSLCFGFEGNDPYVGHRSRAANSSYRTSSTAPTATQGRNLTYEDNKTKNMRGNNIIPGMLTERNCDYTRRRIPDEETSGYEVRDEKDILMRAKESAIPIRNRKAELEAKAMALAMQISRQQVGARNRTRNNQRSTNFTVGVMNDDEQTSSDVGASRNLHLKSYEVSADQQKLRNDTVRMNRMLQKESMSRNKRSQIHNMHHGASSSQTLAAERKQNHQARIDAMPGADLSMDQLQALQQYLQTQGCR